MCVFDAGIASLVAVLHAFTLTPMTSHLSERVHLLRFYPRSRDSSDCTRVKNRLAQERARLLCNPVVLCASSGSRGSAVFSICRYIYNVIAGSRVAVSGIVDKSQIITCL